MRIETEPCGLCGFNGSDYSRGSARATLKDLGKWWAAMVAGIDDASLARRPAVDTWSVIEYAAHTAQVTAAMGHLVHLLEADGAFDMPIPEPAQFGPEGEVASPAGFDRAMGIDAVLDAVAANALRLARMAGGFGDEVWEATGSLGGDFVDADWLLRHAVHDATHHLRDVGRVLRAAGIGPDPQTGRVDGLFTSVGGVPKLPVESVTVDPGGVTGDAQANTKDHGRPFQALCLWSGEVVEALRTEGHPIHPGAAGENVLISGLDWASLRLGTRLRCGDDLIAEISCAATPCAKNAQWFVDGNYRRIDGERHPGWSRLYAWVVRGGSLRPGDPVHVDTV